MTEEIKNLQAQDYDASQIQVLEGLEAVRIASRDSTLDQPQKKVFTI